MGPMLDQGAARMNIHPLYPYHVHVATNTHTVPLTHLDERVSDSFAYTGELDGDLLARTSGAAHPARPGTLTRW